MLIKSSRLFFIKTLPEIWEYRVKKRMDISEMMYNNQCTFCSCADKGKIMIWFELFVVWWLKVSQYKVDLGSFG